MSLREIKKPPEYCDRDAVSGVVLSVVGWTDGRLSGGEKGGFRGQASGRGWGRSQAMLVHFGSKT